MANKANEYNYLIVYNYMKEGLKTISTSETIIESDNISNDNDIDLILTDDDLTPEEKCIKNDNYEKLSQEAKEIISIILHSPQEILELFITPKRKKISTSRLKSILYSIWKSQLIVDSAFREISSWVKKL